MDISEENIKQVLKTFDHFHKLYENEEMRRSVSKEDIKMYFKIAFFVEKTMEKFKTQNCLNEFFNVLSLWNNLQKHRVYSEEFYNFACDHLLEMFLKSSDLDAHIVDVACRMYSAFHPKERFEKLLTEYMLMSASCNYILDYIGQQKNDTNCKEIESHLLMSRLSNHLQIGKEKRLNSVIEELLSIYKIESSLPVLFKLLTLKTNDPNEDGVKKIILKQILNKMCDRSILTKTFWLGIFKLTDKTDLICVALKFEDFFLKLCNFIVYIGSMMNKEGDTWVGDPDISICPEISYHDLLDIIYNFCSDESLKKHMIEIVIEAQATTGSLLWQDVELKITNSM